MSKLIQQFFLSLLLMVLSPAYSLAETQITSPFLLKLKKDIVFHKLFGSDGSLKKNIAISKPSVEVQSDLDLLQLKNLSLKADLNAKVQSDWWK